MPEDVRDGLLGHARKTTGRLYGQRGEVLQVIQVYVDKLSRFQRLFGNGTSSIAIAKVLNAEALIKMVL